MLLHSLHLFAFRAHASTRLTFGSKINLIHGPNGAGKTNLLEAVHYLCLTKSFLASKDQYVLRRGCPFFELEGRFGGEQRSDLKIRLAYVPAEGKRVFINGAPLDRLADLVGQVPVVLFAPADHAITADGPDQRRRFLNNVLSQVRPRYLDDLLKYQRALKQRNALLQHCRRTGQRGGPTLEAWSEELIQLGSRIIMHRLHFIEEFSGFLEQAYQLIEVIAEQPSMQYATVVPLEPGSTLEPIAAAFRDRLAQVATRELELGRTLAGPHLDELVFRLNDFEVRRYASQGQHRTFGLALKLATTFYLREHLDEQPLLLLDDVFGALDDRRTSVFLNLLKTEAVGQCLITTAEKTSFLGKIPFDQPEHRIHEIRAGALVEPMSAEAKTSE